MSKNLREEIYEIIEKEWPVHETAIAKKLGMKINGKNQKKAVARVHYHIKMLKDQEKIVTKNVGGSLLIWPHEIEKIRFIHEMMK
jgi:predicted transcriptional regulator